ncbi:MAG: T9SS type A sorting domain-containing protein [Ignavibacteriaceae bacterium]
MTPFLINEFTIGDQNYHSFTLLDNGNIFSTWQSYGQNGVQNKEDIYACIYNINGEKIKNEFLVSDSFNVSDIDPKCTKLHNGNVLITWQRGYSAGPIIAKIYNPEGNLIKDEYIVNDTIYNSLAIGRSAVCLGLNNGNYIIAYSYYGTYDSIRVAIFNSLNQLIKSFKFNRNSVTDLRLSELNNGKSVIVYDNYDQNGEGVFYRIFDTLSISEEMQANIEFLDDQNEPDILSLTNGDFIISWINDIFDSTYTHLRIFNSNGVPISDEIKAKYEIGIFNTTRLVQHTDTKFLMIYSNADSWNGTKLYCKELFLNGQTSIDDFPIFLFDKSFYGYEIQKFNNNFLFFSFESLDVSGIGIYGVAISSVLTSIESENPINSYTLLQNYPNPFNPKTIINYTLSKSSPVQLIVYNILGKTVEVLTDEFKINGNYSIVFDASNLPSGTYFYQLRTDEFIQSKKMLLIK